MTSGYLVRPAALDDLPAVLRILAEDKPARPTNWSTVDTVPSDRQNATWESIIRTPDVTVYLAHQDGAIAGTACLSVLPNITYDCRPTAFIEAVVVGYAHRRRGVARLIIDRIVADARALGCYKLQLLTHKRHATDGAHDLYRSLGFVAEAEGFRRYLDG